ncbi:actin cross-linking [Artemisia annua]|uniref:Actin cross-linking n=1 Tax=Artemisia annua TaxID=35608 RepID=A0A2U1NBE4_ARTAN|nr:actin cross-linking [Artemisia annua]
MEFFDKVVAIRLKSHLDKYLIAGDDTQTVRQSKSAGSTPAARWLIEHVDSNTIRLKSCYGRYLTACSTPVLLGTTGNKIIQSIPNNTTRDVATEWQPIRDGFQFKLKSMSSGTYLRANGAMPPWRNTVTHDGSFTSAMNNWILWEVETVDVVEDDYKVDSLAIVRSFSSGDLSGEDVRSPMPMSVSLHFQISIRASFYIRHLPLPVLKVPHFRFNLPSKLIKHKPRCIQQPRCLEQPRSIEQLESEPTTMDLLHNAKVVRLRSHHGKYLHADHNEETVSQDRKFNAMSNRWILEFVNDTPDDITIIRLKSVYNKYLTASNNPFWLGMTGKKVLQTVPNRLDSSVEWEVIGDGKHMKLKTRYGHYLRANGGIPPWRNSVTHDIPQRAATQDWIMWEIDIVDTTVQSLPLVPYSGSVSFTSSEANSPSTKYSKSPTFSNHESIDSPLKREEGREIYYRVISDDFAEIDENWQGFCVSFKGKEVNELTKMLEEETRLHDITVCSQSPLDGKLYPLRLQLPPNNVTMKVVVVPNSPGGEKQVRLKSRSCSRYSYSGYGSRTF